jgi:serine O-acetyltransferase
VLSDIPDYAVAVGAPARVVRINQPQELPDYREFN